MRGCEHVPFPPKLIHTTYQSVAAAGRPYFTPATPFKSLPSCILPKAIEHAKAQNALAAQTCELGPPARPLSPRGTLNVPGNSARGCAMSNATETTFDPFQVSKGLGWDHLQFTFGGPHGATENYPKTRCLALGTASKRPLGTVWRSTRYRMPLLSTPCLRLQAKHGLIPGQADHEKAPTPARRTRLQHVNHCSMKIQPKHKHTRSDSKTGRPNAAQGLAPRTCKMMLGRS